MTGMANMANADPAGPDRFPSPAQPLEAQAAVDRVLEGLTQLADSDVAPGAFLAALRDGLKTLGVVWLEVRSADGRIDWQAAPSPSASESDSDRQAAAQGVDREERAKHSERAASTERAARAVEAMRSNRPRFGSDGSVTVPWQAIGNQIGALTIGWHAEPQVHSEATPEARTGARSAAPSAVPSAVPSAARVGVAAAVAEIVARFQTQQDLHGLRQRLANHDQGDAFLSQVHASLELDKTVRAIADEGRAWIGSDRLTVLIRRRGRLRVVAVSGAEHVHRHSPAAERLECLAERVAATNRPLWFESAGEELPPQIAEPLGDYLDASPAISLAILPLKTPCQPDTPQDQPPLGWIVVEQYRKRFSSTQQQTTRRLLGPAATALWNAWRVERIPGNRWWLKRIDRGYWRRWAPATVGAVAAVVLVIAALFGITTDIRLRARGEVLPAQRRDVFAPRDGVVTAVLVESGDLVVADQPLLELRSTELDLETQQVEGELDLARKRLAVTRSERLQLRPGDAESRTRDRRLTAEEDQHQQQVLSLERRLELLREHRDQLVVRAPVAGQVLTWNTQQRLAGRPLRRGESLLTIADIDGPWQAELRVPSRQAGRLLALVTAAPPESNEPPIDSSPSPPSTPAVLPSRALLAVKAQSLATKSVTASDVLPVAIRLTTDPGNWREGNLANWSSRLQTDEAGDAFLLVTVDLELERPQDRVPGATAIASIPCGRGSLAHAWFYELTDAVRLWLPF
ncbi:MAG: HlyD family efflux transporter periplasmic adaptor subunit [Planctomycetaceae bacterium]|nr:MAG: HlyD family efflux transporter periplasmic adaptor subunit [Planctomycetaceae bacterium]